jgi:hypothetical protein
MMLILRREDGDSYSKSRPRGRGKAGTQPIIAVESFLRERVLPFH